MKLVKLPLIAPRQGAREVNEHDAARLLASGSWVRVVVEGRPTDNQRRQARWRTRKAAQGWRGIRLWVRPEVHAALHAAKLPGESLASLLERLLLTAPAPGSKEIGDDSCSDT